MLHEFGGMTIGGECQVVVAASGGAIVWTSVTSDHPRMKHRPDLRTLGQPSPSKEHFSAM